MELEVGEKYKKADFGISGIVRMWSEITVAGELYTFFVMDDEYDNEIASDGFIYECRKGKSIRYGLIPHGIRRDLHRQIFIKEHPRDTAYKYFGKGKYEERYDEKRNKIFL
ncbi:MAG: hypothetical protein LBC77_00420 [Spirochaetaceae bacterium]|jgi:hypothetical protein|nr:hypothetical protein [Spirochaetaceae bacterium]